MIFARSPLQKILEGRTKHPDSFISTKITFAMYISNVYPIGRRPLATLHSFLQLKVDFFYAHPATSISTVSVLETGTSNAPTCFEFPARAATNLKEPRLSQPGFSSMASASRSLSKDPQVEQLEIVDAIFASALTALSSAASNLVNMFCSSIMLIACIGTVLSLSQTTAITWVRATVNHAPISHCHRLSFFMGKRTIFCTFR